MPLLLGCTCKCVTRHDTRQCLEVGNAYPFSVHLPNFQLSSMVPQHPDAWLPWLHRAPSPDCCLWGAVSFFNLFSVALPSQLKPWVKYIRKALINYSYEYLHINRGDALTPVKSHSQIFRYQSQASGEDIFGCSRAPYLIRFKHRAGLSLSLCICGFGLQTWEKWPCIASCFQFCLLFATSILFEPKYEFRAWKLKSKGSLRPRTDPFDFGGRHASLAQDSKESCLPLPVP